MQKMSQQSSNGPKATWDGLPAYAVPRLSSKSKLAEAIRYAISRRAALERFLTGASRSIPTLSSGQSGPSRPDSRTSREKLRRRYRYLFAATAEISLADLGITEELFGCIMHQYPARF